MIYFLDLFSKLPNNDEYIHKSGFSITDESVRVLGNIQHCQEILATKENVESFRKMADILERRIK